jgi:hypothetical protein
LVWASKPSGLRFIGCAKNRWEDKDCAGHASRSSGFLHVEANQARFSQSSLKTGRGVMAGGARGTIAEVVQGSSRRWIGLWDDLNHTLLP